MVPEGFDCGLSRRRLLVAGTGVVLGAGALAACGGADGSATKGQATPASSSGDTTTATRAAGGHALAKVSDVPVGGAVSATDADGKPVIVAQPTAGDVVAFSAICTHAGCTVAPAGEILRCPCHGSTYDLATGDNTGGPAPAPLTRLRVRVQGGEVMET